MAEDGRHGARNNIIVQELCESRGGRPGLSVLTSLLVSVDVNTPSIAFRHPPPISARISYATEGALFISALLSTDAVSALRKVWVLISDKTVQAT